MFKLFFVYPVIFLVLFLLASDIEVKGSVYSFDDNYIAIEFPKEQFRPEDNPQPWYSFYWNANSMENELNEIKDAVVK